MKNGKLLIAPSMLWLGIFFIVPMLIVVAVSFAARTPYGQVVFNWNINNYLRFLEPLYLSIFAQTLLVALVTTVVTILMGYPLAYYIAQLPKRWQQPAVQLFDGNVDGQDHEGQQGISHAQHYGAFII